MSFSIYRSIRYINVPTVMFILSFAIAVNVEMSVSPDTDTAIMGVDICTCLVVSVVTSVVLENVLFLSKVTVNVTFSARFQGLV